MKTFNNATIHLVQSSRLARRIAKLLMVGLFASVIGMSFLPWQQTSRGSGQVIAYSPQDRQQTVEATAKGVIFRIGEGLVEGSQIQKGDFILEIQPFSANKFEQLERQLAELKTKKDTAKAKVEAYENNVQGFKEAGEFAVSAAKELVSAAKAKLQSKARLVPGYEAKELQARLNYERQNSLLATGIKAPKEVEKLKKELDVAKADLASLHSEIEALKMEVKAKESELSEKRLIAKTKVDYAIAMREDASGALATIRKDIADVEIKLKERDRFTITAPKSGTIFRMPVYELGQAIKEGQALFTIIPDTTQKAVELNVNGNDMPLIQKGQEVRLQFEGWPAVQFAGWPSVAVGTFSGIVSNIDDTDNGKGEFRILVTPNENDKPWPTNRYLRQGVRANGWVMLRQVSLGYEIWRQLNGFPVILSEKEPKGAKPKVPKIPK